MHRIIRTVFFPLIMAVAVVNAYFFLMDRTRVSLEAKAQREAEAFCMQWKIGEAKMVDGVVYCRMDMMIPLRSRMIVAGQWFSEEEMWAQNGLLLNAVPTVTP